MEKPKDCPHAGWHRHGMGEACATMPTGSKSERAEQPCCPAGKGRQGITEALRKDLARTMQRMTEEPADAQEEQHGSTHARQIGDAASIVTMDAGAHRLAAGARGRSSPSCRPWRACSSGRRA